MKNTLVAAMLALSVPAWADPYELTLNGKRFTPAIQAGVIQVSDWLLPLGPPGHYDLAVDAKTLRENGKVVGVHADLRKKPRLAGYRCVILDGWDARSSLRDWNASGKALIVHGDFDVKLDHLPALPANLSYLRIDENHSPFLKTFQELQGLKQLRFFQGSLLTAPSLDASLLQNSHGLEYLESNALTFSPAFRGLPKLRVVRTMHNRVLSDLRFVARCPSLRELSCVGTRVTDLAPLEGHPGLEKVNLNMNPVEKLPQRIPRLRELDLLGDGVAEPALAAFRAANPGCQVRASYESALRAALTGCSRIRIRSGGTCHRTPETEKTLAEVTDPAEIQSFLAGLKVRDPQQFGECMCCGTHALEFYGADRLLVTLGVHHGTSLRWREGWPSDAILAPAEGVYVNDWLAARGVRGPKMELEESQKAHRQYEERFARATEGLPEAARDALQAGDADAFLQSLSGQGQEGQIRAIFRVAGLPGPWFRCDGYEGLALQALEKLPVDKVQQQVVEALQGADERLRLGALHAWLWNDRRLTAWRPQDPALCARAISILLDSPYPTLRRLALQLVATWPVARDEFLCYAFADPAVEIRSYAYLVAGRTHDESALPLLRNVLDGKGPTPRAALPLAPDDNGLTGERLTDAEAAAVALAYLGATDILRHPALSTDQPGMHVARALLGDLSGLQADHFNGARYPLLANSALRAVVKDEGKHKLTEALSYNGNGPDDEKWALDSLRPLLERQRPELKERLARCKDLQEARQIWGQKAKP